MDHGGLNLYNPQANNFTRFTHNPYNKNSLINDSVRSIFQDRTGDLWVGTYPVGINVIDLSAQKFEHFVHTVNDPSSLSHSAILSIEPSAQGHLWIGTEGGLNAFNPITHHNKRYLAKAGKAHALQFDAVLDTAEQKNGDLWVGTWSGGLHKLNVKTQKFTQFLPDGTAPLSTEQDNNISSNSLPTGARINSAYVWSLIIDGDNLWIGTETGGLNLYNVKTQRFRYFLPSTQANNQQVSSPHVKSIIKDHAGFIWLGTLGGLDKLDPKHNTIEHYYHNPLNSHSIINNRISTLFEDSRHNIWLGTQGSGITIIDKTRKIFTHITSKQGLPSDNIASITEDAQGNIWATTHNGIVCIHPNKKITVLQKSQGLSSNNFKRDTAFVDQYNNLYVGAIEGVTRFKPQQILNNANIIIDQPQPVVITKIKIANEEVTQASANSPLTHSISATKHLQLNHQQNIIELNFSAFNFLSPNLIQYRYRLNGFDKDWRVTRNNPSATYTNLPPGKYNFEVQASNTQGQWPEHSTQITLHLLPPPWLTLWAYIGYAFIFFGLINLLWRYKSKRLQLQKEQDINSQLIKLDKMKDAFLANTSHELRTPLNGIIGLTENLRDTLDLQLNANQHHTFTMIIQSGLRLSHLVNDILDMSKLGKQEITLQHNDVDLYTTAQTSIALVSPLIGQKPLTIINKIPQDLLPAHADSNRLQQVFLNLLSNAIKYSEKGTITLSAAAHKQKQLHINIKDTGIGISPEHCATVFDSFSQVNNEDTREEGTGLGLSITKKLIELHGGHLTLSSQLGMGSTFSFTLPQASGTPLNSTQMAKPLAVTPTNLVPQPALQTTSQKTPTTTSTSTPTPTPTPTQSLSVSNRSPNASNTLRASAPEYAPSTTILCVDDNNVNLMVLTAILKLHQYNVIEASNGPEALALLKNNPHISLVILDVMMPIMSGYQTCQAIRKTTPMHHLPVIFLTAKDIESEITQGFLAGGNDFAAKPVQKAVLLARVKALLDMVRGSQ